MVLEIGGVGFRDQDIRVSGFGSAGSIGLGVGHLAACARVGKRVLRETVEPASEFRV